MLLTELTFGSKKFPRTALLCSLFARKKGEERAIERVREDFESSIDRERNEVCARSSRDTVSYSYATLLLFHFKLSTEF